MKKKKKDIERELILLKDSVKESAQLTGEQLGSIKLQNHLSIFLSFALSLGLVYLLKIAVYWIPASFLIMYIWGLISIKSSNSSFKYENAKKIIRFKNGLKREQLNHGIDWWFIEFSCFAKSVAINYGISLIILLAIHQGWIVVSKEISLLWSLIAITSYLVVPFLIKPFKELLKQIINEPFRDLELVEKRFGKKGVSDVLTIFKIIFIILMGLGVLLAPVIALIQTGGLIQDWLLFCLIILLQYVSILLMVSYYSSQTALKELTNTLTNYSDIMYQINFLLLYKKFNEINLNKLKHLYFIAKPYELFVEDYMQFIPIYYLIINRTHYIALTDENHEGERER